MDTSRKIYVFLIIITTVVVLIYGQSVIIPFILAIIFWFIIRVIKKQIRRIKFANRLPHWLITIFSSLLLLGFFTLVTELIMQNISDLKNTIPAYQENVQNITIAINEQFDIDLGNIVNEWFKDFKFSDILAEVLSAVTGIFGDAFTVMLYLIFLLLEEPFFPKKIRAMYPDDKQYKHATYLIGKIDHSIGNYIALKTLVSILTGFLSYFVLLFIGVDAPAFWAFLIFILNYIPTIGSIIATIFPAVFALLQFGELTQGILVITIVGSIQFIIGNLLEPKLMGDSLNISPLVVLLTLAAWGLIWGITGMLLSVPITVILIIIMAEFQTTRPIAILLSQNGIINSDNDK